MIVQETTVGKDNRAIGLGGKDTFFGVVDGMSQCIDVISTMLYVRDVLDIAVFCARKMCKTLPLRNMWN